MLNLYMCLKLKRNTITMFSIKFQNYTNWVFYEYERFLAFCHSWSNAPDHFKDWILTINWNYLNHIEELSKRFFWWIPIISALDSSDWILHWWWNDIKLLDVTRTAGQIKVFVRLWSIATEFYLNWWFKTIKLARRSKLLGCTLASA